MNFLTKLFHKLFLDSHETITPPPPPLPLTPTKEEEQLPEIMTLEEHSELEKKALKILEDGSKDVPPPLVDKLLETIPSREPNWENPNPFFLDDGRELHSLQELASACMDMSNETFMHHTQPENHFASWVEDEFTDRTLAEDIRKSLSPSELAHTIATHKAPIHDLVTTKAPIQEKPLHDIHKMASLEHEIESLREQNASLRRKLSQPSMELSQAQQMLKEAQTTLVGLRKENSLLQKEKGDFTSEVSQDHTELKKKIEQLENDLEHKQQQLHSAQEGLHSTQKQLEEAQEEILSLKRTLHSQEETESKDYVHLKHLTAECRKAIDNKNMDSARDLYTQIREEFYASSFTEDERHDLYADIRELYADIELKKL